MQFWKLFFQSTSSEEIFIQQIYNPTEQPATDWEFKFDACHYKHNSALHSLWCTCLYQYFDNILLYYTRGSWAFLTVTWMICNSSSMDSLIKHCCLLYFKKWTETVLRIAFQIQLIQCPRVKRHFNKFICCIAAPWSPRNKSRGHEFFTGTFI